MADNYTPRWGGIVKPHDHNDTFQGAFDRLPASDRQEITLAVNRLTEIRNHGEASALEALAKLGMFLNGTSNEFTRLTILNSRLDKRQQGDSHDNVTHLKHQR